MKFVNISSHPSNGWTEKQREEALSSRDWDVDEIVDVPFPQIDPSSEAEQINWEASAFMEMLDEERDLLEEGNVFHVMGELTFTFELVRQLTQAGFVCVASTTERLVEETCDGEKRVKFNFVRFRGY